MNSIAKISCTLSNGMFRNEYAVEITTSGGGKASLFVDRDLVMLNGSESTGFIHANLIKDEGDDYTVLLPKEVMKQGTRWVRVPKNQIKFA
jgi:hypothetical protein